MTVQESSDPVAPSANSSVKDEPAGPHTPRILCISNQKGGVGKTTTAINLATALAAVGQKVLLIDLDPQGNASTGLGIRRADRKHSSYHLLMGLNDLSETIKRSAVPGLDIVPSTFDLAGAELELADMSRRAHRLKEALEIPKNTDKSNSYEKSAGDYDYILIDCPPSLSFLTINAMAAAHALIVPLQCEFFALEGLSSLLKTVERVRSSFNPGLEIQGIVLTMYDRRNRLSDQVARDVRDFMGDRVYATVIPRNVRISEAPSFGKPALIYDHKCAGSVAYMRLAGEMMRREKIEVAA